MDERNVTLGNIEALHFIDSDGEEYYGFDQAWFTTSWQRMAGCGPTVAATLLHYMACTRGAQASGCVSSKRDRVRLMEAVWLHVTPGIGGVHRLAQFTGGALGYAKGHGFSFVPVSLNIPRKKEDRPSLADIIRFVAEGLAEDCPVAFLNLSNGKVDNLDEWHWVTIVSLDTDATVSICDEGMVKTVDLPQWYGKIKSGGGFTYFRYEQAGKRA